MALDSRIRNEIENVPVPPELERRIRGSIRRRRQQFFASLTVAASILLAVAVAMWPPPPPAPTPDGAAVFSISLQNEMPEPMLLQESQFTADVEVEEGYLVLHFVENGGPAHD